MDSGVLPIAATVLLFGLFVIVAGALGSGTRPLVQSMVETPTVAVIIAAVAAGLAAWKVLAD